MKVYKDMISGDEMFSDSYKHELFFGDTIWEVKSRYVAKDDNFVQEKGAFEAEDEGPGPEVEMVNDIVDSFKLNEIQLTKKDFMGYVKGFLKSVVAKLKESGKEDRVVPFQKGATEAVKYIVGKIDEFQFYTGASYDMEASLALAYQKEQTDEAPTFMFFADILKEEKF